MTEVVSIELLLDDETEAAVRAQWDALAAAGLSSLAMHTAASNRPHITMLARHGAIPDAVGEVARMLPVPILLGAPLLFGQGDRRVLARSVAPSEELLAAHSAAHAAAGVGDDVPHTVPGRWTPHVTLARRLRTAALSDALAVLGGDIVGRAVALRRWDAASRTVTIFH